MDAAPYRPTARLLDLTRLFSRASGPGAFTGIDRVEAAYLKQILAEDIPLFAIIRSRLGYTMLDRRGLEALAPRFLGDRPWGRRDLLSRLFFKATPEPQAATADLRRFAIGHTRAGRLSAMIRANLAPGFVWITVGHSNQSPVMFAAVQDNGGRCAVMIHDSIPFDYPQSQTEKSIGGFRERFELVSQKADVMIHTATTTRARNEHHLARFGRVPDGITALLGIDVPVVDQTAFPKELRQDRPFFVVVGTIEPRKNHTLLLDVWAELATRLPSDQMPDLCIVGKRGWLNKDVFARLDAKPPHVRELGRLPDATIGAIVTRAAALLMPSFTEGFGLPVGEALALGCPVIAADLPIYHEVYGNNPVYLDPHDLYAWAAEIQAVMQAPDRKKAEDFHPPTWDEHFNTVLKVI